MLYLNVLDYSKVEILLQQKKSPPSPAGILTKTEH